jgi:hypothetical protein
MEAQNLTGVWSGLFSYTLACRRSVSFIATPFERGGAISGTVHQQWSKSGRMLFAAVQGSRQGAVVQFVKTYEGGTPHGRPIPYEGLLNARSGTR